MSEALQPVLQWALALPEIFRVWATCDIDNLASARVLERVGMEREGCFVGGWSIPTLARCRATVCATQS
jgi:RimJ/RimL family protein N-acetyltransferase